MTTNVLPSSQIVLNDLQQYSHDQLHLFATNKLPVTRPYAVLRGYAGTGKTTLTEFLIKTLLRENLEVGVAAPTHKAVKVLKESKVDGVEYRTVHSMLRLKEKRNDTTGEITYEEDKFSKESIPIEDLDVLILDEASMLGKDLFMRIAEWIKRNKLRVIFIGDPAQIPPVKEDDAIPFKAAKEWGALELELSEIMRQKEGNPILEFATEVRSNYKAGHFTPKQHTREIIGDAVGVAWEGISLIEHSSAEEYEVMKFYFTKSQFQENADFMKVIAWRNATVDTYNMMIRNILYGQQGHIPDIVVGEKLIMDAPYVLTARNILANNEELEVLNVSTSNTVFMWVDDMNQMQNENFLTYQARVRYWKDGDEYTTTLPIVHETSAGALNSLMNRLALMATKAPYETRKSHWRQYFKLKDLFAQVKYNYSISAHKSQGSSYDQCLVLKWDIDMNRNIEERNRILYVACTRPRHRLFIEV